MEARVEYARWLEKVTDRELLKELKSMSDKQIDEVFYMNLEFGTGGLRNVIGAGTNRLNVYTVGKASQGLANFVNSNYQNPSIAISYDSRHKSKEFAERAAEVFAANGIKAYIYKELMPTPCLSYATRYLHCSAGVMITASHNPGKYNGYKVYGDDGCQITNNAANAILNEINKVDIFDDVKRISFNEGFEKGLISYIDEKVYDSFTNEILSQSVLFGDEINKNIKIVYTPLNGAGLKPVTRALKESGYNNIIIVKEQEQPNGDFPTCPRPNPEINEALNLGIQYARDNDAEILMATDPDSDRVGIAVKDKNDYTLLTGNEVGVLLLDYVCSQRKKHNKMPAKPFAAKTIVTTDLATAVASSYGVTMRNTLTGFKYIGEQAGLDPDNFVFGLEDSYGYLSGTYVRDKDAVDGCFLIAEMFSYYKTRGISLIDRINEIYQKYGYCKTSLHTFAFEGKDGMTNMKAIMDTFRKPFTTFASFNVKDKEDFNNGIHGLPKSNVIKVFFDDGSNMVIRPSGTEPILKLYLSVIADNKDVADEKENEILSEFKKRLNK